MEWFVSEKTQDEYLKHTAGIKARDDLDCIWRDNHMKQIRLVVGEDDRATGNMLQKLAGHIRTKNYWKKKLSCVKPGDIIYLQFPVRNHTILLGTLLKKMSRRGVRSELFIHDLESMRHIKEKNLSYKMKIRMKLEELVVLKAADHLVVHNASMKEHMHEKLGIPKEKMVELGIFDYLVSDELPGKHTVKKNGYSCIVAGNLDREKCEYVYNLPADVPFELYGPKYTGTPTDNIRYHGSFPPAELPYKLEGSFGLVWDGNSADTCAGVYGEYLKVNNPHKTSLYLASGIPVVIWKEAALADFIEAHGAGITVASLYDLKDALAKVTQEDYDRMAEAAHELSKRLTSGYYTMEAVRKCR